MFCLPGLNASIPIRLIMEIRICKQPGTPGYDHELDQLWSIFRQVVSRGDTWPFVPSTSFATFVEKWMGYEPMVAVKGNGAEREDRRVLGTYILKPSQPGLGDHVGTASLMLCPTCLQEPVQSPEQRLERVLGRHILATAKERGFDAIRLDFVVASDTFALELWKDLGFSVVGTVPDAFRHAEQGLTDVHVLHRNLDDLPD